MLKYQSNEAPFFNWLNVTTWLSGCFAAAIATVTCLQVVKVTSRSQNEKKYFFGAFIGMVIGTTTFILLVELFKQLRQ